MYEVELKVRAAHGEIRDLLGEIGAEPLGTVRQIDTYYDHPVRDFAETDEAFRIRRETGGVDDTDSRARVTYKGPLVDPDSKTREELETEIGDGETMASILGALSFEPAATVEKSRERFRYDGYTITLDSVDGLGEFVEVEIEAEEIGPARDGAIELLDRLGLNAEDSIRRSYLGLLLDEK